MATGKGKHPDDTATELPGGERPGNGTGEQRSIKWKKKKLQNASCTGQLLEEYKNGRPYPETTHMTIAAGLFLVALGVPQELSLASSFLSSLSGTTGSRLRS